MNEISYYEEFSEKFCKYLASYLDKSCIISYSCNKSLDVAIQTLEDALGIRLVSDDVYVPKLKIDIVFAILIPNKAPKLLLIEAKFLPQLALKDYSQLIGYLQVAKSIPIGLLLLIQKGFSNSSLSSDFKEIVLLEKLPMDWSLSVRKTAETHNFKTGILKYIPGNGIDWFSSEHLDGISSFEELVAVIDC